MIRKRPSPCKVTSEQEYALMETKTALLLQKPFWATLLLDVLTPVWTRELPTKTAGTDGKHLYLDPDFFVALKLRLRMFVLAHEIAHAMFRHMPRAAVYKELGFEGKPFDPLDYNVAADYVINALLKAEGFQVWEKALLHDDYDETWFVDDVYRDIHEDPPEGGGSGSGQSGDDSDDEGDEGGGGGPGGDEDDEDEEGDGAGGDKDDEDDESDDDSGESEAPSDTGNPEDYGVGEMPHDDHYFADEVPGKDDEASMRRAVSAAAQAATQKGQGKLPAHLQRVVDAILEPQIEWVEELRFLVTKHIGYDYRTWDRPRRRDLTLRGLYLPGSAGSGSGVVAVMADTSGSIGNDEMAVWVGEILGILRDTRPEIVWVIPCDAEVHEPFSVTPDTPVEDIMSRMRGGGGTDFNPPFEWLEEEGILPDVAVYLTDMYGRFPERDPGFPVIWCSTTGNEHQVPFGRVLEVRL